MDTEPCECGTAATNYIWNGMYLMPVCDACWSDPENIVTEVAVGVAECALADGVRHDVRFADLDRLLAAHALRSLALALAARGLNDGDEEVAALFAARWDEWYAPA